MTKARNIADLLDANGDVKSASLDNVPAVDLTNLSASNLTSGSIPDARVPASAVSQHATSFDDNKIVNDISTLAIRQASDQNKSAYNTNSQSVDVFQDDTGIASNTNVLRTSDEYVASIYSDTSVPTITALAGVSENLNPVYSLNTSSGLITHNHTSTGREFTSAGVHGCRLDFGKNVTFSSGLYLQMTDIFDDSSNANMGVCEFNFSTSAGSNWLFQNSAIIPTVNEYTTSGAWDNMTIGGTDKFYNGNTTTYEGRYINLSSLPASIKYSWTENSATISAR